MSSQKTVTTFFQSRKRGSEHHASKDRIIKSHSTPEKLKKGPTVITVNSPAVIQDFQDPREVVVKDSTPKETPEKLGSKSEAAFKSPQKTEAFQESTQFKSPQKYDAAQESTPFKSPQKTEDAQEHSNTPEKQLSPGADFKKRHGAPNSQTKHTPEKLSPADTKKRLGSTNSLATLQARLKSLTKLDQSSPVARRALFKDSSSKSPILSRKTLSFEVTVPKSKPVPPSPVKASPRKQALEVAESVEDKVKNLLQPSDILPLPQSYKDLSSVFRKMDELVAIKHNRNQAITLGAIKADVQTAMRRLLTDTLLKQIRCVLPKAYNFIWEPKKDARGRSTVDYELYLSPNFDDDSKGHTTGKLMPKDLVVRSRLFNHSLLTIVQDHHQEFLKSRDIDLGNEHIHRWDKEFDVNQNCPPIDSVDFPAKPYVESPERNPHLMLAKITGVNKSMEKALNRVVAIGTPKKEETMTPITKAIDHDFKLNPALRDLPPHLLAKIKAQEREKRIRAMTTNKGEQKEVELLEELLNRRVSYSFSKFSFCANFLKTNSFSVLFNHHQLSQCSTQRQGCSDRQLMRKDGGQ
jgi:hypothetical protein